MRVIVDGDAISKSSVAAVAALARRYEVECFIVTDETRRPLDSLENMWITVPVTPDGTDMAILDILQRGDIVVTDDRALGLRCFGNGATPIRSDGGIFDSEMDPARFWRSRNLRVSNGNERERVKAINTRLLEISLADAIVPSANGAFANEETALIEELSEISGVRVSDLKMRVAKSKKRADESMYRHRCYYMPEFDKKPKSPKKPTPVRKSHFTHMKRYASEREREIRREMREIADEYEARFQLSRRALSIEAQGRKTASPAEKSAGTGKSDFAERKHRTMPPNLPFNSERG
jgi:uncharacterized protein YaiI (UPF0178 family)